MNISIIVGYGKVRALANAAYRPIDMQDDRRIPHYCDIGTVPIRFTTFSYYDCITMLNRKSKNKHPTLYFAKILTIFYQRHAIAMAWVMPSCVVCLSVCLSVWCKVEVKSLPE